MKYLLDINDDLWNQFKSKCAIKGLSMRTVIENMIREFILNKLSPTGEKGES